MICNDRGCDYKIDLDLDLRVNACQSVLTKQVKKNVSDLPLFWKFVVFDSL